MYNQPVSNKGGKGKQPEEQQRPRGQLEAVGQILPITGDWKKDIVLSGACIFTLTGPGFWVESQPLPLYLPTLTPLPPKHTPW